ncbi:protein-L-isoaspartate(D-aspartate) O-methyltransferase [Streptomyces sp. TE3672]
MVTAEQLREQCAQEMRHTPRGFCGCAWLEAAFLEVPREAFVPERVWWPILGKDDRYRLYDRAQQPNAWLTAVYRPRIGLVTQLDDGAVPPAGPAVGEFTSSISSPSVIIELLRHLAPGPGDRVLEIGTGTGYTTALLTHRTGPGTVVSVEIDPVIAERAEQRLRALPCDVQVVTGDGELGHPAGAPYDRIVATASVRRIPPAWIHQLRPGGVLVAPLDTPWGHDVLVHLTADGTGHAEGRAVAPVTFMRVRGQRNLVPYTDLGWPKDAGAWDQVQVRVGPAEQRITVQAPASAMAGAAARP